jgi:hypothetical protein
MRYVTVTEVPNSFDHTQGLRSDKGRGEPMLDAGGTSKLTRCNRSTSAQFSKYSVVFPTRDPRCKDPRNVVDPGDSRAQRASPHGHLPTKVLCFIESARVQASNFLPTSCAHLHEARHTLFKTSLPQVRSSVSYGRPRHAFRMCKLRWECYRCWINPVRARGLSTSTRVDRVERVRISGSVLKVSNEVPQNAIRTQRPGTRSYSRAVPCQL